MGEQATVVTYIVRPFSSATGHTWWLVWGPLGKRGEHLDRAKAEEQAAWLNALVSV